MPKDNANAFEVVTTFGGASDEAIVSGFVRTGAIRTGELASFITRDGVPLIAPITRISIGGTDVKVVREGQKANLNVGVEAHDLHIGAVLATPTDSGAYAPTMVASEISASATSERPAALSRDLIEIGLLVNHQHYDEAHSKLLEYASSAESDPVEIDRLFARISLESRGVLHDAAKALEYIKRAYANGGKDNADVLETLAYAHGANGNAQQGLRFLEQLYFHARDIGARDYYEKRIEGFRMRYALPDLWQVIDALGEVIFTAATLEGLGKGAASKAFPQGAKCRKNRIGKLIPIEDAMRGGAPSKTPLDLFGKNPAVNAALGGLAGLIVGILGGAVMGISPLFMGVGAAVVGAAAAGFLTPAKKS